MSQTEPSAPQPKRRSWPWFYYHGWKLILGLLLAAVAIHWLTGYMLERRFVAEIKALQATGQPVTAIELAGPKLPDQQNGAIAYAQAFKMLETKEGEKAADTLQYMMSGRRPVVGKSPSAPEVVSAVKSGAPDYAPVLPSKLKGSIEPGSVLPPIPTPQPVFTRMRTAPTPWPEVIQAVKRLEGLVPIAKEALTRSDCRFAFNADVESVTTPKHYSRLRSLVRVLAALAVVDAHDGRMDMACDKINLAFDTAQANRHEQTMSNASSTMSCIQIANDGLQMLLKYGTPSPTQVSRLNRLLTSINMGSLVVYALGGERAMNLSLLNRMYSGMVPEGLGQLGSASSKDTRDGDPGLGNLMRPLVYQDGITYLRVMSQVIAITEKKDIGVKQQLDGIEKIQSSIPRYAFMTSILRPVYSPFVMKAHATRARTALTQILLAVQRYKTSHGKYPESMAQVRSAGISGIPMDPFSGKDFVYKRTAKGFTAYSVGEDFKDDGGRPAKYGVERCDIVLKWEQ